MAKIDSYSELKDAIAVLETKRQEELKGLKREFNDTKESLKPKNLVKQGMDKVKHSSRLKKTLAIAAAALVTGIIIKKVANRKKKPKYEKIRSENPAKKQVKKVSGTILHYALANLVASNAHIIKDVAYNLINKAKHTTPKRVRREENFNPVEPGFTSSPPDNI
jgi:hypothetical protein